MLMWEPQNSRRPITVFHLSLSFKRFTTCWAKQLEINMDCDCDIQANLISRTFVGINGVWNSTTFTSSGCGFDKSWSDCFSKVCICHLSGLSLECRDCPRSQLECGADVQDHVPRYKLSKDTKIEIIFEQHFKRPTATLKIYHWDQFVIFTFTICSISPITKDLNELPSCQNLDFRFHCARHHILLG